MTYMTRMDKYRVLIIDDVRYVKKIDGETQVLFEFIGEVVFVIENIKGSHNENIYDSHNINVSGSK